MDESRSPQAPGRAQGDLEEVDGRWRLRFTRRLPHPPERVWRALTEPEHLRAWFPTDVIGERVPGARLRFEFRQGEGPAFHGELLVFEPPATLEFTWGGDRLRFELTPDGGGGCVLVLLDTLDEHGRAARDAAGWHECLDVLERHLAGRAPDWAQGERGAEVHPRYVERFGPEAATIGPPEAP
jgi:uncharacterized protein YndB with AHSA1/START domain